MGFYRFLNPTPPVELTVKQKIALLSAQQKTNILNGFINDIPAEHLDHTLLIPLELIKYVYDKIDELQARAKAYMRREVVITPAVTHINPATGLVVIDTPAVMNVAPVSAAALATLLTPQFDDFTSGQVTAIVNAMIAWTRYDGAGTWAFYASQIVL